MTAAAVAAATALAGGAYALGTQSDGSARAAKATATATRSPGQPRGGCRRDGGLNDLASRLGVAPAKLRVALKELRGTQPGDLGARHIVLLSSVAKSLGVSQAEMKTAMNAVRKQVRPGFPRGGPREFSAALAKQLGVSQSKVEQAFEDAFKAGRSQRVDEIAGALAAALNVDKAKVAGALESLRPAPGAGPRTIGPGGIAAALAKQLGLSASDARAAMQKLHAQRQQEMSQARDDFATKLAAKLGISADKVKSALSDHGPFGLHPGPGPGERRRGFGFGSGGHFRHP